MARKPHRTPYTCIKCGSNHTYFRAKTRTRRCQDCGAVWPEDVEAYTLGTGFFDQPPLSRAEEHLLREGGKG